MLLKNKLLFGSRSALNAGLGGVRDVASVIISHEQSQSNRVCRFQTLDSVFPKDLLSDYSQEMLMKKNDIPIFLFAKKNIDIERIYKSENINFQTVE